MKILTVENLEVQRKMISEIIASLGHDAFEAADADQGLAIAGANPDTSLILLEYGLPRRSGISFLQRIKQIPELKRIPVIVIKSQSGPSDMIEALEAGAQDFLPKPFGPELLATKIDECTGK